jgi:hypothetical protein
MKKDATPEERAAFGAKMKAAREAKQAAVTEETETTIQNEDYNSLKAQVEELTRLINSQSVKLPEAPQGAQITAQGIIGTLHKYNLDPDYYPDYSERLAAEPRLARFAFGENWKLEQSVRPWTYTTLDNRRVAEPQFTIQLIGYVFDEDGEKTGEEFVKRQRIWFEDPESALAVAAQNGLKVEDYQEKEFLDEMRYIGVRDWLLENWYAPSNTNKKSKTRQQVIGNQVVDVYEVSSTTTASIPFNTLNGKVKD